MNEPLGFYDEIARVGSEILEVLAGPSAAARTKVAIKTYLNLVAQIYKLLVQVHDEVATVAVRVSLATSLAEAKQYLQGIGHAALKDTFKARLWCDRFERLGRALRPLGADAGLSYADRRVWDEFCVSLEQREDEVARLYDQELYAFRRLADEAPSLEALKKKVEEISKQLVMQKAQFDLLAKRARAMRERLN